MSDAHGRQNWNPAFSISLRERLRVIYLCDSMSFLLPVLLMLVEMHPSIIKIHCSASCSCSRSQWGMAARQRLVVAGACGTLYGVAKSICGRQPGARFRAKKISFIIPNIEPAVGVYSLMENGKTPRDREKAGPAGRPT